MKTNRQRMEEARARSQGALSVKECPECASLNIVINKDKRQLVCKDCGLICGR